VLYWGVIGATALFAPDKALAWQHGIAKRFGWPALPVAAGMPSALAHLAGAAVAAPVSDTLRMYVSLLGLFILTLGAMAGWGAWSGDVRFARAYAAARSLLVAGVCYLLATRATRRGVYKVRVAVGGCGAVCARCCDRDAVECGAVPHATTPALPPPRSLPPTPQPLRQQLLPYLLHGVWHLVATTASGPEFWGTASKALSAAGRLQPAAAARQLAAVIEPLKREAARFTQADAATTAGGGGNTGSAVPAGGGGGRGDTGGQQY
jgi:hypothetical protein